MRIGKNQWRDLVADLGPKLFSYFYGAGLGYQAEDLVQEALIRLVQKIKSGRYDPRKASVNTYAYGIARYVRLEALRAGQSERSHDDLALVSVPAPDESLDHQYGQAQERGLLIAAIGTLKEVERDIVLLMIDRDLTLKEIGAIMNLSENTVKSHMHRAKQTLKRRMQHREGVRT